MDMAEGQHDADDLIRDAFESGRSLTAAELDRTLRHVAAAGFDEQAREAARGPLRGQIWDGQPVVASTRLPPAVRHWLLHVRVNREWPDGTTLSDYVDSLRRVILDSDSGVFINMYKGELSLGIIRQSRDVRGPESYPWVLVQYRVSIGHWATAFQPAKGLDEIANEDWGQVRWLRGPTIQGA